MKKMICVKNIFSVVLATILSITTFNILGFKTSNKADADSVRTYIRHDCTGQTADYEYNLTVTQSNNNPVSPAFIFPPNDMVRDYDESVVRIDGVGGTGFIVGDHLIATAAHCVYNNGFINNFTISIISSNNTIVESISPKYVHINKSYTNSSYDEALDYALIYVEDDLSEYGLFYLGLADNSYILREKSVIASGFPVTSPEGYEDIPWGGRFRAVGYIISAYSTDDVIYHDADIMNGDSGGPLYVEEGISINNSIIDYKTVIGITVSHYEDTGNVSVRVTPDILKFVYHNPYHIPTN